MYDYSYEAFKKDVLVLFKETRTFKPEVIVGVARGGLSLSQALSHAHGLRNVQSVRTELYDQQNIRKQIQIFENLDLRDVSRVLIVDDILDSGRTLKALLEHLKYQYPKVIFKTAVLFYKESAVVEADFKVHHADEWIDFFWEKDFSER